MEVSAGNHTALLDVRKPSFRELSDLAPFTGSSVTTKPVWNLPMFRKYSQPGVTVHLRLYSWAAVMSLRHRATCIQSHERNATPPSHTGAIALLVPCGNPHTFPQ